MKRIGKGFWSRLFGTKEKTADLPQKDSPINHVPHITLSSDREWSVVATDEGQLDDVFLRQQMLNQLSLAQIHEVATALGLSSDALEGGKGRQVMGLLTAVSYQNKLPSLVAQLQKKFPNIEWVKRK